MSVLFVVLLGLPVLYLTGSLKKLVYYTGVGKLSFLMFFALSALLSFLPVITIVKGFRINTAGAFFCLSPAVYLAVKKRFSYRYYLVIVMTALFSVAISLFSDTYAMPFLPYLINAVIAVVSALCFYSGGPIFAPAMMGVYGIAGGIMQFLSGMENWVVFFGGIDMASLCTALCLFISYGIRPRGKHSARREFVGDLKKS